MPGHNGLFARQFPIAPTYFKYSALSGFDRRRFDLFASGHLPAFGVLFGATDRGDQSGGHHRADTTQLLQSPGHLITVGESLDLSVHLEYPIIQQHQVGPQATQ